ncbi:MAG: flippase-like domain-containing protein [Bacteroidales bacterium]|nr:flippase-like domain-containing protein [Bacteroidales bacterium]
MNKTNRVGAVFFAIGILIIAFMLYNLGWHALVDNLQKVGWWIFLIIATRLLMYPLNTMAWRTLSYLNEEEKKRVSWWRMFRLTISGYAINYITPVMALGGEPYRIMAMKKDLGVKRATSSVLNYAMMHILSHFVFWIIGFLLLIFFEYSKVPRFIFISSLVFILLSIIAIIYIVKAYKKGVIVGFFKFLLKIPLLNRVVSKKMTPEFKQTLTDTDKQFTDLYNYHRKEFYKSLFLETMSRILSCAEILVILLAVGCSIDIIDSIIIVTETSLIANIGFVFPMQVGIREGGLALALATVGIPGSLGVVAGIITRISELAWIIIGVVMIKFKRFGKHEYDG